MSEDAIAFGCCRCCCSLIFSAGLMALFTWLALQTDNPRISVDHFYLPALNKTLNSTKNTTLALMVRLDNPNKDKGIHYDDVNLTFFDAPRNRSIGNYTIEKFYQGHKKTAKKWGLAHPDAEAVSRAVLPNGTALFRVDLETAVRFKILFWNKKREKIKVGAQVEVNDQGTKVKEKGIKLKSMAASKYGCWYLMISVFLRILVFAFLNGFN